MQVVASLESTAAPGTVFAWVEDLSRYPEWLDIVPRAEPTHGEPDDPGPAWTVDLRGKVGPLARSKRLRMVRSEHAEPRRVVFERAERDGRRHAEWTLTAEVAAVGAGSMLTMTLHYGGRFWGRPLELMLRDEIEDSKARLVAKLEAAP